MERYDAIKLLQKTGAYMMEHGLAWGNAGNISVRTGEDRFMITASGTFLGELGDDDFVECTFSGDRFPAERKPSKEVPMHQAIYEKRPEIGAVLHASPFYSTLAACSKLPIPSDWFVETMYYLERIARVPYHHPGSLGLGEAVREKAGQANILLLENHGVLVYDTTVKEARMALQTLEVACRMQVVSQTSGTAIDVLSREVVQDFLENAGYKSRREWKS